MAVPTHTLAPRLLRLAALDSTPDADLLTRFVRSRDEAAFAQLVERHGPMVLGVCRRVLGDIHAAEDAFQAAFLALARGAARVRPNESLAAWLYGVAVRVSLKARGVAARVRRTPRQPPARPAPDPLAEITGRELVAAIDEELVRLPEQFRAVVVLCCLEGLSQDEAARRLGWSAGSVKGRLERGREQLRKRLARRGVALSFGLAGIALGDARAAIPPHLFATTVELAGSGCAAPGVVELAAGAVPSGATWKLATVAVLVLAVGGAAAVGRGEFQTPPPKPAVVDPLTGKPTDRFGDPLPDGAVLRLGTTRLRHATVFALAFMADGSLASFGRDYTVKVWDPATGRLLREREFEKEKVHRNHGGPFSPDGRRLAVQYLDRMKVFDTWSGKELSSVKLASSWEAMARFSPDSKLLAVVDQDDQYRARLQLCDVATSTCRELARVPGFSSEPVFSRDGTRLALPMGSDGVFVCEIATGKELLRFKPEGLIGGTVDFDPTGDVLAVLGATNHPQTFHYVRISNGKPPEGWAVPTTAKFEFEWVRFAPDGASILLGGRKQLQWCDPKTGKVLRSADGWAATPPAFSPDGKLVVSARRDALRLFDMATGRSASPEALNQSPEEELCGVAVSPDGKWIVTNTGDSGVIQVWDSEGRPKGTILSNRWGGRYPLFSADGRHLFGAPPDAIAIVRWDFPGGKETARYTFAEPATDQVSVYHFGLSADGKRLAAITQTGNRGRAPGSAFGRDVATFTVWDVATTKRLESREVDSPGLMGYGAFAPDLRWYFHGDRAFGVDGGPEFRLEWPKGWSAWQGAISPDGRFVAQLALERVSVGKDSQLVYRIVIHETATGKQVFAFPTPTGWIGPMAFTTDSRGLIVTDSESITLWDLTTRKPSVRHKSPGRFNGSYGGSFASSLVVTPDGAEAVTGQADTTALVWHFAPPARQPRVLSEQELSTAWGALAGADAGLAYAALVALADSGDAAVKFLRERVKPAAAPADEEVRKFIAQLGADEFADREAAERALRELGDAAIPALRAAITAGLSDEQARRAGAIVTVAESPTLARGERLRAVRAVAVLEWIGTKDAREVLDRLAGGQEGARLTREAKAALERTPRKSR